MVEIRLARIGDAAAVGALFARAFADDPVTSWVTPDPSRRGRVLTRLNTAIARYEGIPLGATYVAEIAGSTVGAAIWQPSRPMPPTWRSVPFALVAGRALGRDMGRMIAMGRAVSTARPPQKHWYLQLLGVDQDAQRSGVGSSLVREHLQIVDRQRIPAYLETTSENVEFYGGLGFRVTGEIVIRGAAPKEYSLYRDAREG